MMKSPKGLAAIGLAVFVVVIAFFMLRRGGTEPEPAAVLGRASIGSPLHHRSRSAANPSALE